ncbi:MAG: hypothetical protein AAGF73_00035 [Actinomycetota bacterium]
MRDPSPATNHSIADDLAPIRPRSAARWAPVFAALVGVAAIVPSALVAGAVTQVSAPAGGNLRPAVRIGLTADASDGVGSAGSGTGSAGSGTGSGGSGAGGGSTGGDAPTGDLPLRDNPIEVPQEFLAEATNPGDAKCKFVDLHTVPAPPNPGFVGESLGGEHVDGQMMWEVGFYLMLYANCERQARGIEPLRMWSAEQMVAMQATYLGQSGHSGYGERGDIVGGGTAEQAGGTLLVGSISHSPTADDDDDDLWSPHEVARRSASGRQHNDTVGLVDHGGAMIDPGRRCIFGTATIGPIANGFMNVVLFYGNTC